MREGVIGREDESAYLVLTYDAQNPRVDKFDHWRSLSTLWDRRLKGRLQYYTRWGRFQYAQTWEETKRGSAHVNIGIVSPIVKTWCQVPGCKHVFWKECPNKNKWCRNCGGNAKGKGTLCKGWSKQKKMLSELAIQAGFGKMVWLAPVEAGNAEKFASYFNKRTSSQPAAADGVAAEITSSAIKGQLPIDAPEKFKRIRFSQSWPTPLEFRKLCVCGHDRQAHVKARKDRATPCCFQGGECACPGWVPQVSEWTGEIRQKPVAEVKLDLKAEEKQIELARAPHYPSDVAVPWRDVVGIQDDALNDSIHVQSVANVPGASTSAPRSCPSDSRASPPSIWP